MGNTTKKILVTGANGQLGQCIYDIRSKFETYELIFASSKELDITNDESLNSFFSNKRFEYIVNCAAYTNVDQAETEPDKAFLINAEGVKKLAMLCKAQNSKLIHISTDYVFDGTKGHPYTETDVPNPINVYGKSKLIGEQYIQEALTDFFIVRTSWLYSQHGKNFYKTILDKSKTVKELTITTAETGTPTNANDLADFILYLIVKDVMEYGVYHFSNLGEATWFDFAKEILKKNNQLGLITLKSTDNYPTFAKRPAYSVLSKKKIIEFFEPKLLNWEESINTLHN
ncbi:dTDP-4-dehydrorhamnose reductase [Aquimarina intermedia]|uniref:dTDP-4-dehydrorhamnose reductase n=1 Tax=Aquimarina intermedia TaxID=350814 RepID=A0A5S5CCJ2_9FLAO|nr:dTDP-4-dehydrorhamnose reductase [Aquimarina intermedia]TYP76879.1 dTDP-4-dehydrorhamnose reductase [Aquimarina intermedia]